MQDGKIDQGVQIEAQIPRWKYIWGILHCLIASLAVSTSRKGTGVIANTHIWKEAQTKHIKIKNSSKKKFLQGRKIMVLYLDMYPTKCIHICIACHSMTARIRDTLQHY